nr:MAG TPA: hypothetical protein [Caudoviricetes sp.]
MTRYYSTIRVCEAKEILVSILASTIVVIHLFQLCVVVDKHFRCRSNARHIVHIQNIFLSFAI